MSNVGSVCCPWKFHSSIHLKLFMLPLELQQYYHIINSSGQHQLQVKCVIFSRGYFEFKCNLSSVNATCNISTNCQIIWIPSLCQHQLQFPYTLLYGDWPARSWLVDTVEFQDVTSTQLMFEFWGIVRLTKISIESSQYSIHFKSLLFSVQCNLHSHSLCCKTHPCES